MSTCTCQLCPLSVIRPYSDQGVPPDLSPSVILPFLLAPLPIRPDLYKLSLGIADIGVVVNPEIVI